MIEFLCPEPEDTEALGERLGHIAPPNTVIAFRGGLGAGKTALSRGLAKGIGIDDCITSPTYTIVNEYEGGRLPLYHIDAYRLSSAEEFELIDAARYLFGGGVCAIEWSERVEASLPQGTTVVEIEPSSDGSRSIRLFGPLEDLLT